MPVVFGTLGAIYFLKKGDIFGVALAFWAGLSLLAYTLASEKMPWLLVNITLPFILLAGRCTWAAWWKPFPGIGWCGRARFFYWY